MRLRRAPDERLPSNVGSESGLVAPTLQRPGRGMTIRPAPRASGFFLETELRLGMHSDFCSWLLSRVVVANDDLLVPLERGEIPMPNAKVSRSDLRLT
jgi:hypothetical protein